MTDVRCQARRRQKGRSCIAMLPSWIIVLTAIELVSFLAFALSVATAAPEEVFVKARAE